MAGKSAGGPNLAQCFGHYQQQTVQYAIQNCLSCSKVKACVRAQWGLDRPRREQRRWGEGKRRGVGERPPWPSTRELLAT
jgi:hypothetical protein